MMELGAAFNSIITGTPSPWQTHQFLKVLPIRLGYKLYFHLPVFKHGLLWGTKKLGHDHFSLLNGFNSKFLTSISASFLCKSTVPGGRGYPYVHVSLFRVCNGFPTIQSKTKCINHGKFCLEQGIEFCNIYKIFSTRYKNSSRMRIGLTGLDVHECFLDSQARPVYN